MLPGLRLRPARERLGLTYPRSGTDELRTGSATRPHELILHMAPLLRPRSVVLVDATVRDIENDDWCNEFDGPLYFAEVRDGHRCGWFQREGVRLLMQPHPLSRCVPEEWRLPDEAEVVGRVVGVVTRLNEPWSDFSAESPAARGDSNRKAP